MTRVPAAQAPPAGAALRDSPAVAAALARIKPEVRAQQAYTLTAPAAARDRKSTRLNSSHSQISYAVFCLKKKKHVESRTIKGVVVRRAQGAADRRGTGSPMNSD